jgi:hypothetical protein
LSSDPEIRVVTPPEPPDLEIVSIVPGDPPPPVPKKVVVTPGPPLPPLPESIVVVTVTTEVLTLFPGCCGFINLPLSTPSLAVVKFVPDLRKQLVSSAVS